MMDTGWVHTAIGKIVPQKGLQTGPFGSQLKADEYTEDFGGVPVVMPQDILAGKIITDRIARTTAEKARQLSKHLLKEGDILFPRRGDLSRIGLVSKFEDGWLCGTGCLRARIGKNGDPRFLSFYLTQKCVLEWLEANAVGQTMLNLNTEIISNLPIYLPTLPEQRKIAEILRAWDDALEKLNALRRAKERRLVGLRGMLMARAGRTSKLTTFGAFLAESRIPGGNGATANKISVRLYGMGAVEKSDPRGGSARTRYYHRKEGQIIWSKLDFLNGAFALVSQQLDGFESTLDLPAFDCMASVNSQWLVEYLIRPAYYRSQVHLARGQRKARRIAPEDWLNSPIRLPDRATQDRIVEVLSAARHDLALTKQEIEALSRQKHGLMQKLLTGEWRVSQNNKGAGT